MITGADIRKSLIAGELRFSGEIRGDALLLTLGETLLPFTSADSIVEPWDAASVARAYAEPIRQWRRFELGPRSMILASVREEMEMPTTMTGEIGTLSHVARLGLAAHLTSPFVDACFAGHLTLELVNMSCNTLCLRSDMPVAKLLLFRHSPSSCAGSRPPYGSDQDLRSMFYQEYGDRWD